MRPKEGLLDWLPLSEPEMLRKPCPPQLSTVSSGWSCRRQASRALIVQPSSSPYWSEAIENCAKRARPSNVSTPCLSTVCCLHTGGASSAWRGSTVFANEYCWGRVCKLERLGLTLVSPSSSPTTTTRQSCTTATWECSIAPRQVRWRRSFLAARRFGNSAWLAFQAT